MDRSAHPVSSGGPGHETHEADVRHIAYWAVGLFVLGAIIHSIIFGVFKYFESHQDQGQAINHLSSPTHLPPEPRLEVKPWETLPKLRSRETRVLSHYGYADEAGKVVHIPIDTAIDEIVAKLPVRSGISSAPRGTAANTRPQSPGTGPGQPRKGNERVKDEQ